MGILHVLGFAVFVIGAASAQTDTKCTNDAAVNDCFADLNAYFAQFPDKQSPWKGKIINGSVIKSWLDSAYFGLRLNIIDDVDICSVPDKFKAALNCGLTEAVKCSQQRNGAPLTLPTGNQAQAGFDFICSKSQNNEFNYCLYSAIITGEFQHCASSKKKDIPDDSHKMCRLERVRMACSRRMFAYKKPVEACNRPTEDAYLEYLSKYVAPTSCKGCSLAQFQCVTSGQCLANNRTCDGVRDCADGSDENTFCTTTPGNGVNAVTPASLLVFFAVVVTSLLKLFPQ